MRKVSMHPLVQALATPNFSGKSSKQRRRGVVDEADRPCSDFLRVYGWEAAAVANLGPYRTVHSNPPDIRASR